MTHRIIYSSEAADNVTDADFRMIAMFSRMNNRRHDIAGLLLHYEGHIMQILEGPRDAVKELYAKIEADARHKNVKLLMDETCDKPIFSEWSMGFRPMESLEQMDAFFELSKNTLDDAIPDAANEDVHRVVGDFAKNAGLSN